MIELPGMLEIWDALPGARVAGGAVRDWLAGREIADVDFATPLEPSEVMRRLRNAGIKAVPTGLSHGTVTAVVAGRGFEITTLRRDVETDGRHAVVEFTDDWTLDASRRDFTINAMFLTRGGELFDYFGGREDLAAGRVRFVGSARERIAEDYLRILRFFRFFARYGKGPADAEAVHAISLLREGVRMLSVERVWSELKKILVTEDPRGAVTLMQDTGVLALVIPDANLDRFGALVADGGPQEALLRVAALMRTDAAEFTAKWKLSGVEAEALEALRKPLVLTRDASDAELRAVLADEPAEILIRRSWLTPGRVELRARLGAMEAPEFPLRGGDVTALGIAPGPRVGAILQQVREWWKAGGCVADAEECRKKALLFVEKALRPVKQKNFAPGA